MAADDSPTQKAEVTPARALASLNEQIDSMRTTSERIDKVQSTAEETLKSMRDLLDRWDAAKARFGEALDSSIRRIAEGMQDSQEGQDLGPPEGVLAHGTDGAAEWSAPECVVECNKVARPKMNAAIKAHEYRDSPEVLRAKVKMLADMVRNSKCCVAYTGAGISTAAGISDYASQAGTRSSVLPKKLSDGSPFAAGNAIDAEPTLAHRALTSMHGAGHLHEWVQQNHDGLPQKAGFPQSAINEIHGSWFDPANPVVPMDGRLRADLVGRLREAQGAADLVLAMGTSMSGVMADTLVSSVGRRALEQRNGGGSGAGSSKGAPLGSISEVEGDASEAAVRRSVVIINAQQTRLDRLASLRIFARIDDVLKLLCKELALPPPAAEPAPRRPQQQKDVWEALPYDRDGMPSDGDKLTLDLTAGKRVVLTHGNAPLVEPGSEGTVGPKTRQGHYTLVLDSGRRCTLGRWMLHEARAGRLDRLSLVNAPRK